MTERFLQRPYLKEPASSHASLIPEQEQPHLTIEQPGKQGQRSATQIEVFTGAVRMTGPSFRIEVQGSNFSYQLSGDQTVFSGTGPDQARLFFGVGGDGAVMFRAGPEGAQAPQAAPTGPSSPSATESPGNAAEEPLMTSEGASEASSPPAEGAAGLLQLSRSESPAEHIFELAQPGPNSNEAEPKRVQLAGTLGRDPSFRTTKNGSLIGKFPLAVHNQDGTTNWHTVLAFGGRAEQLQRRAQAGELAQGHQVNVVGFVHTNTRLGKDGRARTIEEVYAVAVAQR